MNTHIDRMNQLKKRLQEIEGDSDYDTIEEMIKNKLSILMLCPDLYISDQRSLDFNMGRIRGIEDVLDFFIEYNIHGGVNVAAKTMRHCLRDIYDLSDQLTGSTTYISGISRQTDPLLRESHHIPLKKTQLNADDLVFYDPSSNSATFPDIPYKGIVGCLFRDPELFVNMFVVVGYENGLLDVCFPRISLEPFENEHSKQKVVLGYDRSIFLRNIHERKITLPWFECICTKGANCACTCSAFSKRVENINNLYSTTWPKSDTYVVYTIPYPCNLPFSLVSRGDCADNCLNLPVNFEHSPFSFVYEN